MVGRRAILVALLLAACTHAPATQEAFPANPEVWAWKLVRAIATRPNGEPIVSRRGKNPSGFITCSRDGHMASQIAGAPQERFSE